MPDLQLHEIHDITDIACFTIKAIYIISYVTRYMMDFSFLKLMFKDLATTTVLK